MIDDLIRDLSLLQKADALLGRLWLKDAGRRLGLVGLSRSTATVGLAMANVAGYLGLEVSVGSVWAATLLAITDFALAGFVLLVATSASRDPEVDRALDARRRAVEAVKDDGGELTDTINALRQDVRDAKDSIAAFVHDPFDVATQKVLIPAATSILRGLHPKSGSSEPNATDRPGAPPQT